MENLEIEHIINDGIHSKDIKGIDGDNYEEQLEKLNEIKKVIIQDLKRIYNCKLQGSLNNSQLSDELEYLFQTYLEEKMPIHEFIYLTDNYLCFNNQELLADEECLCKAIDNDEPYVTKIETIVIIPRDFKRFYFLLREHNTVPEERKDTLYEYKLTDDKVEFDIIYFDGFVQTDFSNEDSIEALITSKNAKTYQKKKDK